MVDLHVIGANDAVAPVHTSTPPAHSASGFIVLLRHGQTAWSVSGQHTGRTDIPLTETGVQQAIRAGRRLRAVFPEGFPADRVFTSPLHRAQQTAEHAGFTRFRVLDALAEWDYGRAEGRTRQQVAAKLGRGWKLWDDGPESLDASMDGLWVDTLPGGQRVTVRNTRGETLLQVAARAQRVLDTITPIIDLGHNVLLVAHAHILRVLTVCWLGLQPDAARLLSLDTAHFAVLSRHIGDHIIKHWNC